MAKSFSDGIVNDANNDHRTPTPPVRTGSMRRLIYLRDLLAELVIRDMKLRYERSLLGVAWAVVRPLAQLMVFVFVFKHVIRLNIPNYTLYVFTGVLTWNWTREALLHSANSITRNRGLINQPGFPVALLPVVAVATPLVDLLVAVPLLLVFVLLDGGRLTIQLLALPLVIGLQFLLLQGVGYLVASAQVMFRDMGHLLGVGLMLGFYLTPVFYSVEQVPSGFRSYYALNPMTYLLEAYRSIIMRGEPPNLSSLLLLGGVAVVLCWAGHRIFVRTSHYFAEEL